MPAHSDQGKRPTRAYVLKGSCKGVPGEDSWTVIASLEEAMFGLQQLNIFEEIHFEMDDVEAGRRNELLFDRLSTTTLPR